MSQFPGNLKDVGAMVRPAVANADAPELQEGQPAPLSVRASDNALRVTLAEGLTLEGDVAAAAQYADGTSNADVVGMLVLGDDGSTLQAIATDNAGKLKALLDQYSPVAGKLPVDGSSVTQPVSITDGVDTATVRDVTGAKALDVALVDASGNQVTSFGGGVQYTEGDTDATITGSALLMEGAGNALVPLQGTAADGLLVNLGANNDVTGTVTANAGTNLNTSALALESGGNLASIKSNTDKIPALGQALAAASVPVVLPAAQVSTLTPLSTVTANLGTLGGAATEAKQDTLIGHVDGIETLLSDIDAGKLEETTFTGRVGEVQASPTANTLLGRLKAIEDALSSLLTELGQKTEPANTQTISGTVTANAGTNLNTSTLAKESGGVLDSIATNTAVLQGLLISIDGSNDAIQTAVEILDNAISGNEIQADIVAAIPAGDNAIGRVKLTDGTDVATVRDVTGAKALDVALVDGSGNQVTSFGGGTQYTEGDTDASITGTAMLWEDGSDTLRSVSAAKPLPVNVVAGGAGDGAILDGVSSSIKATVLDYTNSNPLAVRLTDTSGDYVGAGAGTQYTEDAAAAANPTGTALIAVRADSLAAVTDTDGDNVAVRGTNKGELYVKHADAIPASQSGTWNVTDVSGTVSLPTGAATETTLAAIKTAAELIDNAISGTEMQVDVVAALPTGANTIGAVNLAQYTPATGRLPVDGSGVTQPVSGSVTANAGTNLNTSALALESGGNLAAIKAKTDNIPAQGQAAMAASLPVVIASNQTAVPVSDGGGVLTVDGTVAVTGALTDTELRATAVPVSLASVPSHAVTNAGTFAVQESGAALTALQLIDDAVATTASAIPGKGLAISGTDGTNARVVKVDTNGELQVDVLTLPNVTVGAALPAGSNQIGGVNVSQINGVTPLMGAGNTGTGSPRVTIASDQAAIPTTPAGGVAHDGADSGNPLKVGARAINAEIAAVANNDRTDLLATLTGKLITHPYTNPENIVSGAITTAMTGTTSTSLVAAPGAGLRNYITTIIVSNAHATVGTDVIIQDGSGGTTLLTIPAAAVYGGAIITLPVPLRQPTTNTALYCANVTTGASTKVSAVGYKAA